MVRKPAVVFVGVEEVAPDMVFFTAMYSPFKKMQVLLKDIVDEAVENFEISALEYTLY